MSKKEDVIKDVEVEETPSASGVRADGKGDDEEDEQEPVRR